MGKCSKCGKKILYNSYKVIEGIVYCLKCEPKPKVKMTFVIEKTVADAKLNFTEFESAMKETAIVAVNENLAKELKPKKKPRKKSKR